MLRLWIPALLWLAVIAWESLLLSAGQTSRFIIPLLHLLFPWATPAQLTFVHAACRKAGHFAGYAILSLLFYHAWWGTILLRRTPAPQAHIPGWKTTFSVWSARAATLAWLGTVLVASLDEMQQSLRQGRTASAADVLLDSAGGWFAQMILLAASSKPMRVGYAGFSSRLRCEKTTNGSTGSTDKASQTRSGLGVP